MSDLLSATLGKSWLSFIPCSFRALENMVYRNMDKVFAVSRTMTRLIQYRSGKKNVLHLPDWYTENDHHNVAAIPRPVEEMFNRYSRVVTYAGNIGVAQNIGVLCEIATSLQERGTYSDVGILVIGDGVEKESLVGRYDDKCKNLHFTGTLEKAVIPKILSKSHVAFLNFSNKKELTPYMSSKIYEYAVANVLVLGGGFSELRKFIEKNELGIATPPSDKEALLSGLIKLLEQSSITRPSKFVLERHSQRHVINELLEHCFASLEPNVTAAKDNCRL